MSNLAISAKNISKSYKMYASPADRLKELIHPFSRKYHKDFWALKDVSFDVKKGECLGIIGRNGSGKSTLLQILCGVLQPTSGAVSVNGRISALLELGAGFNPEFTGRDNVYMNGALMGFQKEDMDDRFGEIADFADIGDFIDQPVKTYSSGMFVRLAFACAVNVDPDILIVDEALSVGDALFQAKSLRRIEELMESGVTILFVSHNLDTIRNYCSSVVLLDNGRVIQYGLANEVCNYYHLMTRKYQLEEDKKSQLILSKKPEQEEKGATGKISDFVLLNEKGEPSNEFSPGDMLTASIKIKAYRQIRNPAVSFLVRNLYGQNLIGVSTFYEKYEIGPLNEGATKTVLIKFKLSLFRGEYLFTIGFADQYDYDLMEAIDSFQDKHILRVGGGVRNFGLFLPENVVIEVL